LNTNDRFNCYHFRLQSHKILQLHTMPTKWLDQ
jgi:hypothetical protein